MMHGNKEREKPVSVYKDPFTPCITQPLKQHTASAMRLAKAHVNILTLSSEEQKQTTCSSCMPAAAVDLTHNNQFPPPPSLSS